MSVTDKVPPKVFISYSHDSPGHKQWVSELAKKLHDVGIETIFDQWHLSPGEDITQFMEQGLRSADRVLVVCTGEYVRKANAGQGGVGYERMIVTAELIKDLGTKKFIPVVRDSLASDKVPTFLGARLYVDLSDEIMFDDEFDRLVREIHQIPKMDPPPVGPNPFSTPSTTSPPSSGPKALPAAIPLEIPSELSDPHAVYETAVGLARAEDILGWRQLVKKVRTPLQGRLVAWRQHYDQAPPNDQESLLAAVNQAIEQVAPLIIIALTGVESRMPQLRDQRALFDDLYNISGWNPSGRTVLVSLPDVLGFIYHSLHGAMCVSTDQIDLAFALTDMEIRERSRDRLKPISACREIMSRPIALGERYTEVWAFLTSSPERWPWLTESFGTAEDFKASVSAYFMMHSLDEFASYLALGHGPALAEGRSSLHLNIPLCFAAEDLSIRERAFSILLRNVSQLQQRWQAKGVEDDLIVRHWPDWMRISHSWLDNVFSFFRDSEMLPYAQLFARQK